jgi:hypothetical protein
MSRQEREAMKSLEIESKIFGNIIKMLYYAVAGLRMDNELTQEEVETCFKDDDRVRFVYATAYWQEVDAKDVKTFIKYCVKVFSEEDSAGISKLNPDNFGGSHE